MRDEISDGGPAFPIMPPVDDTGRTAVGYPYPDSGMSLRDWFAGQALAGMLAAAHDNVWHEYATAAYEVADAMIAERDGGAQ